MGSYQMNSQDSELKLKNILIRLFSRHEDEADEDDLRQELIEFFGDQSLQVENEQIQMILSILRIRDLTAEQIRIPATRMISIPVNTSLKDCIAIIKKSGHTRIPVYEEKDGRKNFTGILYAKDLLTRSLDHKGRFKLSENLHELIVIPETQGLLSLLRHLRMKQIHLVMTVNEYGDITGLVTLEDILEEIVGDIRDEYDSRRSPIREVGHRIYRVDGSISLKDLNQELTLNLPEEKFNTLSGFILHELKGVIAEKSAVDYGSCVITVTKIAGSEVRQAEIKIPPPQL